MFEKLLISLGLKKKPVMMAGPLLRGVESWGATFSYISTGAANQDSMVMQTSARTQVIALAVFNTSASVKYVRFYDTASAPTSANTPILRLMIPSNGGFILCPSRGFAFSSGIGFRITGGAADNDTTAVTTNDVLLNMIYG